MIISGMQLYFVIQDFLFLLATILRSRSGKCKDDAVKPFEPFKPVCNYVQLTVYENRKRCQVEKTEKNRLHEDQPTCAVGGWAVWARQPPASQ